MFRKFVVNNVLNEYACTLGYLSDDGRPQRTGPVDLSAFRDVVGDCLDYDAKDAKRAQSSGKSKSKGSKDIEVEKFSGLRIQ